MPFRRELRCGMGLKWSPRARRESNIPGDEKSQPAELGLRRSLKDSFAQSDSRTRPHAFFDLFRTASSQTLTRAGVAVAIAWLPLVILSAIRGNASFMSFLKDYATQSRFLIVLPVLILAEPPLHDRLAQVSRHFEKFLVSGDQVPQYQADWNSFEKLRNSNLVRVLLVVLTYATAAWLGQYLSPDGAEFVPWLKGGGGFRFFSPGGTWVVFISYPILIYFTFLWLWRVLLLDPISA